MEEYHSILVVCGTWNAGVAFLEEVYRKNKAEVAAGNREMGILRLRDRTVYRLVPRSKSGTFDAFRGLSPVEVIIVQPENLERHEWINLRSIVDPQTRVTVVL